MKTNFRLIFIVAIALVVGFMNIAQAQSQNEKVIPPILFPLLLDDDWPFIPLNDTGIVWGGNSPTGNNITCTSNMIFPVRPQDCTLGRDATYNDDSDGHAGFSFTKLSNSGQELSFSASNWTCVKDNVTGLVWEVKQNKDNLIDPNNIHDADNTYRWGGKTVLGSGYGDYYNDWNVLVDGSNNTVLCGFSNWRVPTIAELMSLANFNQTDPAIDTTFFPNTKSDSFWSASPSAQYTYAAWHVHFGSINTDAQTNRVSLNHVRLVRSRQ